MAYQGRYRLIMLCHETGILTARLEARVYQMFHLDQCERWAFRETSLMIAEYTALITDKSTMDKKFVPFYNAQLCRFISSDGTPIAFKVISTYLPSATVVTWCCSIQLSLLWQRSL